MWTLSYLHMFAMWRLIKLIVRQFSLVPCANDHERCRTNTFKQNYINININYILHELLCRIY
jgi:hypothetical protein